MTLGLTQLPNADQREASIPLCPVPQIARGSQHLCLGSGRFPESQKPPLGQAKAAACWEREDPRGQGTHCAAGVWCPDRELKGTLQKEVFGDDKGTSQHAEAADGMGYQAKCPLQAKVTVTTIVRKLGTWTWVLRPGLSDACSVTAGKTLPVSGPEASHSNTTF